MTTLVTAARDVLPAQDPRAISLPDDIVSADDTVVEIPVSGRTTRLELAPAQEDLPARPPLPRPALEHVLACQRPAHARRAAITTAQAPATVRVPGIGRDVVVKAAADRCEWEAAFQLVAASYRTRGYEAPDSRGLRFTAFHALPDTTTFIAKQGESVVATLSLVVDNTLLQLPMECVYGPEVRALRREGRRLGEVTSLADTGLGVREFLQVFSTIIRLMVHYHISRGGDTCVISVNPRHRNFYTKVVGFRPLGPRRSYPCVQDAPAEAYYVDMEMMKANAPRMYDDIAANVPPAAALLACPLPPHLARYFGGNSSQTDSRRVGEILDYVAYYGSPRAW
jgi:hypothetical protein